MTKDELVAFLNAQATKSAGKPVTKRILSDWIDEGLLGPARARGREIGLNPEWHLAEEAIEYAQLLQALRALSVKRTSSLRIYLWMFCQDADLDRILEALRTEYRRILQRFRRTNAWLLDAYRQAPHAPKNSQRLKKLSSQLDPSLRSAGFEMPIESLFELSGEAIDPSAKPIEELIASGLDHLQMVAPDLREEVKSRLLSGNLLLPLALKGSFGDREETAGSVEEALEKVGAEDLIEARNAVWTEIFILFASYIVLGLFAPQHSTELSRAYLKAFASALQPDWLAFKLGLSAVGSYRLRTGKT